MGILVYAEPVEMYLESLHKKLKEGRICGLLPEKVQRELVEALLKAKKQKDGHVVWLEEYPHSSQISDEERANCLNGYFENIRTKEGTWAEIRNLPNLWEDEVDIVDI